MLNKKIKNINGIVISVSPYKDESAIVSLITEKGLFSVYVNNAYKAKNILKPLLIPFNYLLVEYVDSDDKFIIAKYCEIIKEYFPLFNNYKHTLFLQTIIQLISFLYSYDEIFNLLSFLTILDCASQKKDLLSLLLLFIGNIYRDLGLKQNSSSCVFCNSKENIVSFSLYDGGFICESCLSKQNKFEVKDKSDLFVFKYAFNNSENKAYYYKKVPLLSGIKVLKLLCNYLEDYFGIQKLSSIDTFISYLINEKKTNN